MNKILKVSFFIAIILFINTFVKAENKQINLKYFLESTSSDMGGVTDSFSTQYLEIETLINKGKWDFYGFHDMKSSGGSLEMNGDFYKYILRYDLVRDIKFVTQIKDTYAFGDGDLFFGLGTTARMGKAHVAINALWLTSPAENKDIKLPFAIQVDWFGLLKQFSNGMSLTYGGWADVDLFTGDSDDSDTEGQLQFYQGITFNITYDIGLEAGYKYWMNTGGKADTSSHSGYLYFIKRI